MSKAGKKKIVAVVDSAIRDGSSTHAPRMSMAERLTRMSQKEKLSLDVLALPGIILKKKKLRPNAVNTLRHLADYDWLIFTSKNAVEFFMEELRARRIDVPRGLRIATVGPETSRAVKGWMGSKRSRIDLTPKQVSAKHMVHALGAKKQIKASRILFPRSAAASFDAIRLLRARGVRVTTIPLYTPIYSRIPRALMRNIETGKVDYFLFMSPSAIGNFMKNVKGSKGKKKQSKNGDKGDKKAIWRAGALCIGPSTAAAARARGFEKIHVAKTASEAGLADLLRRLA